jgi:peptidoglycan/LPS O-acetylase OafA/YrhL
MTSYRPDVDGLRAVAVLAVLAFHAFPALAPGGFTGVDVFFVISGFLISGIIFEDLKRGRFTLANFYWRRIRRIFPALILVLAACLAIGWLVLLPDEYSQLGRQVAAGAGFIANLALWMQAGYFDWAAEMKPLLHLWSLGVEEQYYVVWPLLLYLFRRHALAMIAVLGAASFALNIYLTAVAPSAAFYLPVTRFWELLAGSALAWLAVHGTTTTSNTKAFLGAILVLAGFALIHGERAFPGAWALLPVAGTALLIAAGPQAWLNRTVLAHPAAVFVGLISYPLYLWHWPLLSFARIVERGEVAVALRIGLLILSFLLAWATYQFLEKPIRFGARVRRVAVPALAASMAAAGLGGVVALQGALEPHSASLPMVGEISRAAEDWQYRGDKVVAGDAPRAVLFLGDSHMQHYWPRIEKVMSERAAPVRTVMFKSVGGCAPVPGIERKSNGNCSRFVKEGFELALRPEVDTVVIAASWVGFVGRPDYYKVGDESRTPLKVLAAGSEWVLEGFEAALRDIVARGKRVAIVLSSPRGPAFDPKSLIDREAILVRVQAVRAPVPRAEISALAAPIDERLKRIAAAAGAEVIDPNEWLCTPKNCPTADEAGRPLYKDDTHLRASFARERFGAIDEFIYLK